MNLVYCHVGDIFPECLIDSLYQSCVIHTRYTKEKQKLSIYIITNAKHAKRVQQQINDLNVDEMFKGCIFVVPSEFLLSSSLNEYTKIVKSWGDERYNFRGNFWVHTTSRFFYIAALMKQFLLENVFHIENDVLVYTDLNKIYSQMTKLNITDKIAAVQDAKNRAICSFVYLPNATEAERYTQFIIECAKKQPGLNDMDVMGMYSHKTELPDSPSHPLASSLGVFDAAAIGQYIGGIDFKNIPNHLIRSRYINPTKGFINETANFKPNTVPFYAIDLNTQNYTGTRYILGNKNEEKELRALHVHSKQLYLYSSVFDVSLDDIITGDRIVSVCDFVIVDDAQFRYNSNLLQINRNVILVKDFNDINTESLNHNVDIFATERGKDKGDTLKLFVFIDLIQRFQDNVLPLLSDDYTYEIYIHNGDYSFDDRYQKLIQSPKVKRILSQNVDLPVNDKVKLLPIGLARYVFPHGNLDVFYTSMINNYWRKKTKSIFVNINYHTYPFRKVVLDTVKNKYPIKQNQDFQTYTEDLAQHFFSLSIRGNGLDTHRFWESLYLGTIPVLVDDGTITNFRNYLLHQNIPHYVTTLEVLANTDPSFFNEKLYNEVLSGCILRCKNCLKLKSYV